MSATITSDLIKATVEKPNKILNCENIELTFYIKEFEGLGELLVVAKKEGENRYDVKYFDWMKSMKFTLVDQSNNNKDKSKFKDGVMDIKKIKYIEKQGDMDKYINKNMSEIYGVFGVSNLD